jgi:hypothetical protein
MISGLLVCGMNIHCLRVEPPAPDLGNSWKMPRYSLMEAMDFFDLEVAACNKPETHACSSKRCKKDGHSTGIDIHSSTRP